MKMLNCYKTVKWILSALPFFFTSGLQHAFVLFSDSIAQPAPGQCRFERVWDFPTSILQSKVRVCAAERSNESPSGAFKRQNGLRQQMEGLRPDKFRHDAQDADNARKNTAFPPVCKKCAKVCRTPENEKSHEESCDSSWDFGALEGTRIPDPLIKSQMLYRLSYERICAKIILPNNITTTCVKKQVPGGKSQQKSVPCYLVGIRSPFILYKTPGGVPPWELRRGLVLSTGSYTPE